MSPSWTTATARSKYELPIGEHLQALQGEEIPDKKPQSFHIEVNGKPKFIMEDGKPLFRIVRDGAAPTDDPTNPGGTYGIPLIAYTHPETDMRAQLIADKFPELLKLLHDLAKDGQAYDVVGLTGHMPQAEAFVKAAASVWPVRRKDWYPQGIILSVGPGNPAFA